MMSVLMSSNNTTTLDILPDIVMIKYVGRKECVIYTGKGYFILYISNTN